MGQLVVMVGLQGSGKSTLVAARFADTHHVVSKDHWPNARNKEARQLRLVEELLRSGDPVVVDNTSPTVEVRAPLVALGRALATETVAVFLDVPVPICHTRNASREGRRRVPDAGFYDTVRRLTRPTIDEGFDRVEVER